MINILKLAIALSLKASPEVRHENLSPFIEANFLPFELGFVSEAGEIVCEKIYKSSRRFVSLVYAF